VTLRKLRAGFVTAILFAVTVRVLWWAVEPMIPYFIVGLALVTIVGFVVHRKTRW
jgi:putative flippase GtrA